MYGYLIERDGVPWSERFWFDIPAVKARGFGGDTRARIFISKDDADNASEDLNDEFDLKTTVVRRADLYPPPI